MGVLNHYKELLPITDKTPIVNLEEGMTPLIHLPRVSKRLGISLYGKFEGCNPSGSFKDRGMVLAVAKALEEGKSAIICASKTGCAMVNSVNPYRLIGQRSGAWEICDVLGKAPDWHAIPVGNAGNISAYWAGYNEYYKLGKISALPKMMGFQAEGAAPLVYNKPCPNPETVATAIRIGNPVSAHLARAAVSESGGEFNAVTDEQILEAQRILAAEGGVFAEPASCAPLAGLLKLKRAGRLPEGITVTMILTGNGLKDPDTAMSQVGKPIEINDTLDDLMRVLEAR